MRLAVAAKIENEKIPETYRAEEWGRERFVKLVLRQQKKKAYWSTHTHTDIHASNAIKIVYFDIKNRASNAFTVTSANIFFWFVAASSTMRRLIWCVYVCVRARWFRCQFLCIFQCDLWPAVISVVLFSTLSYVIWEIPKMLLILIQCWFEAHAHNKIRSTFFSCFSPPYNEHFFLFNLAYTHSFYAVLLSLPSNMNAYIFVTAMVAFSWAFFHSELKQFLFETEAKIAK